MSIGTYPKRLIEVDLPIRRISAHARREKSIRHGHISTLHIWWARRPLAACRAVICAALWPDPADPLCPHSFREKAREEMLGWTTHERQRLLSEESRKRFEAARMNAALFNDEEELRGALLDFIADYANWDSSSVREYLDSARVLTGTAHAALGGEPGARPLVVDPFAGGGSIPLEALRSGADAFASDLNPIPVLLNKVILEYAPKYRQCLADEIRRWGEWIKREAQSDLSKFYPVDPDGATPIAYLWARTIRCEGPGCGVEVPLLRSLWLSKKPARPAALEIQVARKQIDFEVVRPKGKAVAEGTLRNGSATCPVCQYTTPNARVRHQLKERRGGVSDARLVAVVTTRAGQQGRFYRLPLPEDLHAAARAAAALVSVSQSEVDGMAPVPNEEIPSERPSPNARGLSAVTRLGMVSFGDLFSNRQKLTLLTLVSCVKRAHGSLIEQGVKRDLADAVSICLSLAVSRLADRTCALCRWRPEADQEKVESVFSRQALSMVWDYAEGTPFTHGTASWADAYEPVAKVVESLASIALRPGHIEQLSATATSLPDDCAQAFITDPPYYDSIPYADISDFFYVWLRRSLSTILPDLFRDSMTPKDQEVIWNPSRIYSETGKPKDEQFYESQMKSAFAEGRRVTTPSGIGVVVFAHKSTAGWEAVLSALLDAGWTATASWPIDTEMGNRTNALGTASLASSIHIVCRPRENPDGTLPTDEIGDWRDVLNELPKRIHEWMPRLASEGVVGADAIFACIGPALEIFSRYSRVEKASGEQVTLKEYLEKVWEAVAKEALTMIFKGADATGFEEDARLTAMWLWTLSTAKELDDLGSQVTNALNREDDEDDGAPKAKRQKGYFLEFDAARKIAQGLGAYLDDLDHLVEIKGDTARLLPVEERAERLFGQASREKSTSELPRRKQPVLPFSDEQRAGDDAENWSEFDVSRPGDTVLDRVHQSLILHAAGRGVALKRFLVDEGIGNDERFWRLAQALSALYPQQSDEKRWVDGVLARKKGLGF
jgi:putative DNA methylase